MSLRSRRLLAGLGALHSVAAKVREIPPESGGMDTRTRTAASQWGCGPAGWRLLVRPEASAPGAVPCVNGFLKTSNLTPGLQKQRSAALLPPPGHLPAPGVRGTSRAEPASSS